MEQKKKPPKPGSKKAQMLKKLANVVEFKLPNVYVFESVLMLEFDQSNNMKLGLGRVHVYYEKQELRGPLKGVNMPAEVYWKWRESGTTLTDEELSLFEILHLQSDFLYIVAWIRNDNSTLLHEWAHAYYHFQSDYRTLVSTLYNQLDQNSRIAIEKVLKLRNYSESVYEDEFQAYVREDPADFGKQLTQVLTPIHVELKKHIRQPKKTEFTVVFPLPVVD